MIYSTENRFLARCEDVNEAERFALDPAMRAIADLRGLDRAAAWTSKMGWFETEWLGHGEELRPTLGA